MSSEKLLTISIAAYNKQEYINECLESLIIEKYIDKIEVFVIDDGGTDSTINIARGYEEKFPNTFKVVHKENAGYGSTVNFSIEHANGKYFKLLDGDDFFDKEGFKKLLETLEITDSDVIFTKFTKLFYNDKLECVKKEDGINYNTDFYDKIINIKDFTYNCGIPMHAITYKTKVLKDSNLKLKEHMLYTDNYYAAIPFSKVKSIIIKDINVYNYRLGLAEQTMDLTRATKHLSQIKDISIDLVNYYNKCKETNDINVYLRNRIASTCVDYFAVFFKSNSDINIKTYRMFDKEIKKLSYDIYYTMGKLDRSASKILNLMRKSSFIFFPLVKLLYKTI